MTKEQFNQAIKEEKRRTPTNDEIQRMQVECVQTGDETIKYFKFTGDLNQILLKKILNEVANNLSMRTNVRFSFGATIEHGNGQTMSFGKTLKVEPAFTTAKQIRDYIFKCEGLRLGAVDP